MVLTQLRRHTRKLVLVLACLFCSVCVTSCWATKQDEAKFEELKAIASQLPTYAGMQEISSTANAGYGKAIVSKGYRSNARYDDVKRFYIDRLEHDGWQLVSERQLKGFGSDLGGYHLEFHKGDTSLGIEYAGEKADYEWQYAIAVSWSRWIKKK
jgi:hypothetical protein